MIIETMKSRWPKAKVSETHNPNGGPSPIYSAGFGPVSLVFWHVEGKEWGFCVPSADLGGQVEGFDQAAAKAEQAACTWLAEQVQAIRSHPEDKAPKDHTDEELRSLRDTFMLFTFCEPMPEDGKTTEAWLIVELIDEVLRLRG
jgi:hypothetical protein